MLSIDQLVGQVVQSELRHVVLTGGEPLLPAEVVPLCDQLRSAGLHITVETAGTVDRLLACDLMSISPKFRSSAPEADQHPRWHRLHQQRRLPLRTMRALIDRAPEYQLKFVVDSPDDFAELDSIVEDLRAGADEVWVMPQGSTNEALDEAAGWLQPWCQDQGYQYCDRMQIRWFGNRRGT